MATLLTNLRLWDGLAERALDRAALLVEGAQIAWAGPAADAPEQARGAERVDCGGGTLLPGLIDCHIHVGSGFAPDSAMPLAASLDDVRAVVAAALDVGITAARDLGARDHSVIRVAREIATGKTPGPHMIAAGRPLALPGGYSRGVAVEVDTPAGVRAAVAEQVAAGAGVIKIIASPVPPVYDPAFPRSFGPENLAAAAEAAHAAGLRLTAHAHSLVGARDAVRAGFDCIEHGYRLDADTIAEMARRGTWLTSTLVAMEAAQAGRGNYYHTLVAESREHERWDAAVEAVRQAHRAGVRIATGTDAVSIVPVDSVRREVALLVEPVGLTPVEALRAATSAAADLLGIAHETGTITPGYRADLLLVDGDPLADPHVLTRVRGIWRAGQRRPVSIA